MSYDLTLRGDEAYSRFESLDRVRPFLDAQPGVRRNGPRDYVLDDGRRWMEIDIETVSEEGDNIEDESTDADTFNCIRAHIPYGHLGARPEEDYFKLLRSLSELLNWPLEDEQADTAAPRKPWWRFWR